MSKPKYYAIVFPNYSKVVHKNWDEVRILVEGVSNIKYKGFINKRDADLWIKEMEIKLHAETKLKKVKKNEVPTKMELMRNNINSVKWNRIKGKIITPDI